ncbi:hypothetical protein LBMAG42_03950 [Deltaproteobacteria bacterium]|nr:hypothetical protein LBMAG42_03950 [Deltaproteobacteria bacterium]
MDQKDVRSLLRLMKSQGVAEFSWKQDGAEMSVKFGGYAVAPVVVAAPPVGVAAPTAPSAAPAPKAAAEGRVIRSPIVGTFYRSPSPDQAAYVSVGDKVRKGQVVCIVEAMKLMNQVESDVDGVVAEILVDNSQPVQFGQELFRLTPG